MNSFTVTAKFSAILDLIRFNKQYGTLLLLCPTLWSLFLASGGSPSLRHLVVFILGTFLMRSAGCTINDIADRDFDRYVERTRTRPLASGRLGVGEALWVFFVLSLLAFSLVLLLNPLTIALSFVGLALASVYPFVKRVSNLPQVFLGIAFGWGAIMAWTAVKDTVELPALLIFLANVFWSTAYDTIYALMDKEDDLKIGVKSTAILFGRWVYHAIVLLYGGMILCLWLVGWLGGLGIFYFTGILSAFIFFLLLVKELRRSPTRETAFRCFVANVFAGLVILLSISIDLNL